MSKMKTALQLARGRKIGLVETDDESGDDATSEDTEENGSESTLPVVVKLEPSVFYDLDSDVLVQNRIIDDDYPEDALTSYKMLRTRLLQRMKLRGWRKLAVTSPRSGAGKSLTAINLAIAMASHGAHDVYLLDLDLRNPRIGRSLGLPGFDLDLGEFLAGRIPLSQVCCQVEVDRLFVLPSSQIQSNSSELVTSQTMQSLFRMILATSPNAIVIVDLPAVLAADDALAISPWIDAFLMVVSESETDREDVTRSAEMLRDATIAGVVLNKSSGDK